MMVVVKLSSEIAKSKFLQKFSSCRVISDWVKALELSDLHILAHNSQFKTTAVITVCVCVLASVLTTALIKVLTINSTHFCVAFDDNFHFVCSMY